MNFLQLLASGASILNFNFQSKSKSSQTLDTIPKVEAKIEGFKKVDQHAQIDSFSSLPSQMPTQQATFLNQMLYNERQELINRYLQLNLQLLEGKISKPHQNQGFLNPDHFSEENMEKDDSQNQQKNLNSKKKIKKSVKCGHDDKAHYAKGMCNNCYHKYGRTKKPWNCPHEKLYAGGMCQNCYINMYNKKKREQQQPCDQKFENLDYDRENVIEKKETLVETQQKQV